jgi:NAD(P)-dependent dehydrogenase (short-subunit alcohol dehydrogenase family)
MTDARDAHTEVTSLKGRRAIVSGGTTGIGRAIAVLLASEGAHVFICGRNPDHLADALARIREVGEGDGIAVDLAEPDAVARFFDAGVAAMGGVDIAVINAAIGAGGLTDMSADELRYAIAVNFTGYLMSAHAAVERMTTGDIVFTGSVSAHILGPSSTVYAGIKAGVAGFAEALRKELGPRDIRVGLIEPGLTGADMTTTGIDRDEELAKIADHKMLRAEDIAAGVHFMLTQSRRAVVQQLTIVPRAGDE